MDHQKFKFSLIAVEAVEAVEVIESAEDIRPGKSQPGTSESSRFFNSGLF